MKIVIHHSAGVSCTTKASCITQVKSFQNLHIGYFIKLLTNIDHCSNI